MRQIRVHSSHCSIFPSTHANRVNTVKIENTEKIARSCRILLITEEHFGRLFRLTTFCFTFFAGVVVLNTTFFCDVSIWRPSLCARGLRRDLSACTAPTRTKVRAPIVKSDKVFDNTAQRSTSILINLPFGN